jgi:hypothetical protein
MSLLSYASIAVYDKTVNNFTTLIRVPIDHPFVKYKIVTTDDISLFDYKMTILPLKLNIL